MANEKNIGPQRIPAAILLLWGVLHALTEVALINIIANAHFPLGAFVGTSRLCTLGMAVLLFIGKRNVGFVILSGMKVLLQLQPLVISFSFRNLFWTAADVCMLLVTIFATLPSFSDRVHPMKKLTFLPAVLSFLPCFSIVATMPPQRGMLYIINGVISALGLWLMAQALATDRMPQNTRASSFQTYVPAPAVQPQPQQPVAQQRNNGPGVLLVRFSIDKLNRLSGPYGFQSGKLIGQAVPAALLEGMTICDGDSAATLRGREYVCVVSISTATNRAILQERIEPLILASEEIRACGDSPLTQLVSSLTEPLVADGVVRNGSIEGPGGWCASGFMSAWKEQAPHAPVLEQPAPTT